MKNNTKMKKLLVLTGILFCGLATESYADNNIHCTLKIDQIHPLEGHLNIALYNSAATYEALDGNKAFKAYKIKVDAKEQVIDLGDLPPGDYWISFYHDANDNGKLDKNFIGIPKEGYGFSNNGGQFGPPSVQDAKLHLEKDTEILIHER